MYFTLYHLIYSFMKNFLKFFILTFIFTVVIFLINYFFFVDVEKEIEETYVEPTVETTKIELEKKDVEKQALIDFSKQQENQEELPSASKYFFFYIPTDYERIITSISKNIWESLDYNSFNEKIKTLDIEFFKEKIDTRWKLKDGSIKLFDPEKMWEVETLTVFVHEFGHYIDIYFLQKKLNNDPSSLFYDISWESTKVKKSWLTVKDFVSGYAMTNKYEDFAESFAYYVLHNSDFKQKTEKSDKLKEKYNFFKTIVFRQNEFYRTDFSYESKVLDYYWDITKIDIDLQKFLQYLEKWI